MHLTAGNSFLKFAAVLGAVGLVVGAAASLAGPKRYVSTGVVRVESEPGADDRFPQVVTEVLSRSSLAEIIQRPSLDLYRQERAHAPMEDIVQQMRQDIRVAPRQDGTVEISFSYADGAKAEATVRALMNVVANTTERVYRHRASLWQRVWPNDPLPGSQRVLLVSEPQLPEQPIGSGRPELLALGGAAGLLAAWLIWRPKRNLALAGFALAGMVVAVAGAFAIGDRYTSTAVIRLTPLDAPARMIPVLAPKPLNEQFRRIEEKILSDESLQGLIERRSLLLYQRERQRQPMPEVAKTMRQDLQIRPVGANAFSIRFTYSDRYKAQGVVRELITKIVEEFVTEQRALAQTRGVAAEWRAGSNLEVLDPASLPETPVFPNRLAIGGLGLPVGLLAGVWLQRRKQAAQPA